MIVVSHISFAQYPTTKIIKGEEVVIMTVPQAKAIDNKFLLLKDSIKLINVSLFQNKENLRLTSESLINTNKNLSKTQDWCGIGTCCLVNHLYNWYKSIIKIKSVSYEKIF